MTKHAFLEGMGLGGAGGRRAIGMAVAAKSMQSPDVRRMAWRAVRKMDHMKDDLADTLAYKLKKRWPKAAPLFILDFHFIYVIFNIIKPK